MGAIVAPYNQDRTQHIMDDIETNMLESMSNLRSLAEELVGSIVRYENTSHKKVLRTIRTLSSALGHAGKDFRAASVAFEKSKQ